MQAASLKPLSGVRVLVTRPMEQAEALSGKLRVLGATAIELPTIQVVPAEETAALDKAARDISEYDWAIFTSVHGVQFFMKRMAALNVEPEAFRKVRVAAIGPATAAALEREGKKPDYIPNEYLSGKIVEGLGVVKGRRILLPRADIAARKLPALLRKRGALVDEVVAYRTVIPRDLTRERLNTILSGGVDLVTFTSPSTVRNMAQVLGGRKLRWLLRNVRVACIGPVTVEAARKLGIDADIVAETHTIDALVDVIVNEIRTV